MRGYSTIEPEGTFTYLEVFVDEITFGTGVAAERAGAAGRGQVAQGRRRCPCARPGTKPVILGERPPPGAARSRMSFDVGDKVVYPHHGAAVIERRERRGALGADREYLVLHMAYDDLTLSVPVDSIDTVGLRDVIDDEEISDVYAVLAKKDVRTPTNWSRRFKNHAEKLKSGDIYQVAEVVRNLSMRRAENGLSAGETTMLSKARRVLVSELSFALDVDDEEAGRRLDAAMASEPASSPTSRPGAG